MWVSLSRTLEAMHCRVFDICVGLSKHLSFVGEDNLFQSLNKKQRDVYQPCYSTETHKYTFIVVILLTSLN